MMPEEENNAPYKTKEEIEMLLDEIPVLKAEVEKLKGAVIQLSKRITRLQDHKEDRK